MTKKNEIQTYKVLKKLKKTKAAFFDVLEEGDIVSLEEVENGKFLISKNNGEKHLLTSLKLEKGFSTLELEEQNKETNEDKEETSDYLSLIKVELESITEELKGAQGKRKRYLKKWKTRVEAELKKETLISKLIH